MCPPPDSAKLIANKSQEEMEAAITLMSVATKVSDPEHEWMVQALEEFGSRIQHARCAQASLDDSAKSGASRFVSTMDQILWQC